MDILFYLYIKFVSINIYYIDSDNLFDCFLKIIYVIQTYILYFVKLCITATKQ